MQQRPFFDFATTVSFYGIFAFAATVHVVPAALNRFDASSTACGMLIFSMYLIFPLTSLAGGWIADRIGRKPVLACAAAMAALSFVGCAIFNSLIARALFLLLHGAGSGALEGQASTIVSELHPHRQRRAVNLSQVWYCAGAVGGPWLVGILVGRDPQNALTWSFFGGAGLMALAALLFLALPRVDAPAEELDIDTMEGLFANPVYLVLLALLFMYVAVEMGTANWLAKYGEDVMALDPAVSPRCIAWFWLGLAASRLAVGMLPARWRISNLSVLTICTTLSLIFQAGSFSFAGKGWPPYTFAALGLAMGPVWPTIVSEVAGRFPARRGTAVGGVVAAGALAIPAIQPFVGMLAEPGRLGLRVTLLGMTIFPAIMLGLLIVLARKGAPGQQYTS